MTALAVSTADPTAVTLDDSVELDARCRQPWAAVLLAAWHDVGLGSVRRATALHFLILDAWDADWSIGAELSLSREAVLRRLWPRLTRDEIIQYRAAWQPGWATVEGSP